MNKSTLIKKMAWHRSHLFLIGPLGTNTNEISVAIQTFLFKKTRLKMSSAKWWPFCSGSERLKSATWKPVILPSIYATFVTNISTPGPISQTVYEPMLTFRWNSFCFGFDSNDPVNLHMSRELGCRDMCKIVTWTDQYIRRKINTFFARFGS